LFDFILIYTCASIIYTEVVMKTKGRGRQQTGLILITQSGCLLASGQLMQIRHGRLYRSIRLVIISANHISCFI